MTPTPLSKVLQWIEERKGHLKGHEFQVVDASDLAAYVQSLMGEENNLVQLEAERLAWSKEVFTDATPQSSLNKLEEEIKEVREGLSNDDRRDKLTEEYADCLMCLFDSAGRIETPITPEEIIRAFEVKLIKNKSRKWKKNDDNTYSHVK